MDKWDYYSRDCHHLGLTNEFDYWYVLEFDYWHVLAFYVMHMCIIKHCSMLEYKWLEILGHIAGNFLRSIFYINP